MTDPDTDGRFLSRTACQALAARVFAMATGGGTTRLIIDSRWTGNLRWARNDIVTGGDTQQSRVTVSRLIREAAGSAGTNALTDDALLACVTRAESLSRLRDESPEPYPDVPPATHPHATPTLWFDTTVRVDDATMSAIAGRVIAPAEAAAVVSAGYLQLGASGSAVLDTDGLFRYYPYTTVQYSVTVRDPRGHGSGWAGVDWSDWTRVDTDRIATTALDKCMRSRNPVAIEPGRYTTILESQAVSDLVSPIVYRALSRQDAEQGEGPFADPERPGYSRIGQRVIDPRLTLSADPMDPDCGFVPFDWSGEPYQPVRWIERGVLNALSYPRGYGLRQLGKDMALPNSYAFRLGSVADDAATIDAMIAETTRGLLVTRLDNVRLLDFSSMLCTGTTRDGLWLVERGRISKAVKNFRFTESPLFALNNVERIGAPQRVFRPDAPAVVASLVVRDFSFTSLVDAV